MKEFADKKFKFDENGRKFFKLVGNTVEKGEIARYEQFLLFHNVFKRLVLQTRRNKGLFGKGLNLIKEIYKHLLQNNQLFPTGMTSLLWLNFSLH